MLHSGKPISELGLEALSERLKDSSLTNNTNKPDFREFDLMGSPISPLRTRTSGLTTPCSLTNTTSSSSSSGSVSGRTAPNPVSKAHSGELFSSTATSPTTGVPRIRPGHRRSGSCGSLVYSGGDGGASVNSPPLSVHPTGNICPSGRILKTGMSTRQQPSSRHDVLGSGTGNYGHGSIMRAAGGGGGGVSAGGGVSGDGDPVRRAKASLDPEEVKRVGNEEYKRGHFSEALSLYDRAIAISPTNAAYWSNRAAALTGLGRVAEAVMECEEALRLDPGYGRARQRLGSLLIRLGQVEIARKHLCFAGQEPETTELQKLQAIEKHLTECTDARKIGDWKTTLREGNAAITAGADCCPQLFTCRAESLLKLQQLDDIDSIISNIPKIAPYPRCCSESKFFGMHSEAYLFYVRAQIDMALGRFESAVTCAEKAGKVDPWNVEIGMWLNNVRVLAKARGRGNDLFKSERFTEACAAYGEGLKLDPSNSVLYCNRAACWFKLGMWERSIEDCNHALKIRPNYNKALLRRAASNTKLKRWAEAVRDYEFLRRELPHDNEVIESLFHAKVALKRSRGEVEEISTLEQFITLISAPGVSVVHFGIVSNPQCKRMSSSFDVLCGQYPSINFLKVDVEQSPDVANSENVRIVPTFKIYKNGSRVKEIVNPTSDVLEASVRQYSF